MTDFYCVCSLPIHSSGTVLESNQVPYYSLKHIETYNNRGTICKINVQFI